MNPGADAKVVWDDLLTATVESLDPDTGATLDTANSVTVLRSVATGGEQGIGEGAVGFDQKTFWLVVSDVTGFTLKNRDRITVDGVGWIAGNVNTEAFDTIYVCRDCIKERV